MKFFLITIVTLVLGLTSALAAGLGEMFQTVGPWHILKSKDAMTDEVSCIAIYKDNAQVQVTSESLAIGLRGRGGVAGYKIRIDDLPAGELKLASKIEKDIAAVVIGGADFQALLRAKRVRFQAITVLSTLVNEDLDFSQAQSVLGVLNGPGCKA